MLFLIFHYVKNILPIQKTQYMSELKGKFLYYCPPSLNLHEFTRPSPATASFPGKHSHSPHPQNKKHPCLRTPSESRGANHKAWAINITWSFRRRSEK